MPAISGFLIHELCSFTRDFFFLMLPKDVQILSLLEASLQGLVKSVCHQELADTWRAPLPKLLKVRALFVFGQLHQSYKCIHLDYR